MSEQSSQEPDWLDEFEELANRELAEGSACVQVHPIIQRWYHEVMENEPLYSRDSVLQAMACLATEILGDAPDDVMQEVLKHVDADAIASWIEYVLMVGRAFETALRQGDLDDL